MVYNTIKRYPILAYWHKKFLTMENKMRPLEQGEMYLKSEILRILPEAEAMSLRVMANVSIGIVVIIPRFNKELNRFELTTITEKNAKDPRIKTKFPSGGLMAGEHPFAGAERETVTETGYKVSKDQFIFVCAAEYSTTVTGETHYKVYVIAPNYIHVGEPIYDGEDMIISVDWRPFKEIERIIPKAQRTGLQPVIEKLKGLNPEYAWALMNERVKMQFVEGVYDIRIVEEKYYAQTKK